MHKQFIRIVLLTLTVAFISQSAVLPGARAAVIDTATYMAGAANPTKAELQTLLNRQDVRQQLEAFGVDPADAERRIAALTPAELEQLQSRIDELPAGANVLAILGALLLVLIILELLGVTNVFTKL